MVKSDRKYSESSEDGTTTSLSGSNTGNSHNLTRRRVIKLAGVGGITGGVWGVPTVSGKEDGNVEIVTLADGDCPVKTQKVPERWYNHTKNARKVKDSLSIALENQAGIHAVAMGRSEEKIDGFRKHNITITISPGKDTTVIPSEKNGIPVNIKRDEGVQLSDSCDIDATYYDEQPSSIEGGILWNSPDCGAGTLCCRVKWYNNGSWDKYMLSSRHIYTGELCDHNDPNNRDWCQYNDTVVGTCVKEWQRYDSVLLNLDQTNRDYAARIVTNAQPIEGRVTPDGLDCFKSNDTRIEQNGVSSGYDDGEIISTNADSHNCTYNNNINGMVSSTLSSINGDSGGPQYYTENGKIYIVGMHVGSLDGDTVGMSAAHLNDKEGLWFGPGTESGSC